MKHAVVVSLLLASIGLEACKKKPDVISFSHKGSGSAEENPIEEEIDPSEVEPGSETLTGGVTTPSEMMGPQNYSVLDASCGDASSARGLRQWRRLSNVELNNTIKDVFGDIAGMDSTLVGDVPRKELYDNLMIVSNYIGSTRFKSYRILATTLGEKADLSKMLPCFANGLACVTANFLPLAEKAWRRPLTAVEASAFTALYNKFVADKFSAEQSMRFMLEALAQSQPFLYRSELGLPQSNGDYKLTSWEVASALSYGLTRRPPDETLRALATADKLGDSATIKAQAERLLATAQAQAAMKDFGSMWLGSKMVTEISSRTPGWTPQLRQTLSAEMEMLFGESFFDSSKALKNLFAAESVRSTLTGSLPYGTEPESNILKFKEKDRRGIFGTGAFLAGNSTDDHASPVKRGVFILNRLLCVGFEPPAEIPPGKSEPGQTNKDLYKVYETCSAGCHTTMNQYGFPFENFNGVGSYITTDAGQPIVTDNVINVDGKNITVKSALALNNAISGSNQLYECFSRQVFRYSFGRLEKFPTRMVGKVSTVFTATTASEADRCEVKAIADTVKSSKGDMKAGIVAAFTNPGFLIRINGKK